MSERDEVLALVDDLARLARERGAARIEVETVDVSLSVSVDPAPATAPLVAPQRPRAEPEPTRVHAGAVGIFSAARPWSAGDPVERGLVLGAIQSLGHMAEVTAPLDGRIGEVLVTGGSPVEYGQPLFVITPPE